jgi:hypothetical protein
MYFRTNGSAAFSPAIISVIMNIRKTARRYGNAKVKARRNRRQPDLHTVLLEFDDRGVAEDRTQETPGKHARLYGRRERLREVPVRPALLPPRAANVVCLLRRDPVTRLPMRRAAVPRRPEAGEVPRRDFAAVRALVFILIEIPGGEVVSQSGCTPTFLKAERRMGR